MKFFCHSFQEWSRVSYEKDSRCIYHFDDIPAAEKFSRSSEFLSLFFLSSLLVWFCSLRIFTSTCNFLIYYYVTPWEFFTSALADGLSVELEWQQISSRLLDSSQYSGRSQKCCSLDGLHSSFNFQIFQSLYHSFSDCTNSTNYSWYHCHFHVP